MTEWIEAIKPETVAMLLTALCAGGVWGYLSQRNKGKTDLVAIAQKAAGDMIEDLRQEIQGLRARVIEVEKENLAFRSENRKLQQREQSIDAWLRRQGIELPGGAEGAYITIEGDNVSALKGRPA